MEKQENVLLNESAHHLVSYATVLSVVTQWGGALRDDTKNGYLGEYTPPNDTRRLRFSVQHAHSNMAWDIHK